MIELFNEGKPVDLITLQERLKEKDVPAEIAVWNLSETGDSSADFCECEILCTDRGRQICDAQDDQIE